jgi:hypothetical protein
VTKDGLVVGPALHHYDYRGIINGVARR